MSDEHLGAVEKRTETIDEFGLAYCEECNAWNERHREWCSALNPNEEREDEG